MIYFLFYFFLNFKIFSCSVAQSCPTLCDPMDCGMPGFPILHHLLKFAQIHVHWVSDAIQSCHPLLLPSIFPSTSIFSNELALCIRQPKHWSFSLSISWHSAFFMVQLSPPYMTTGKTIVLTIRIFVGKVMSWLSHTLPRVVTIFLPRSKH